MNSSLILKAPIEQVLVGLRPRQRRDLDRFAKGEGISRSELLRRIIDDYIERRSYPWLDETIGPP
jgi:metal-responsive CopG/Arc/MetJ family transcriptional regulator